MTEKTIEKEAVKPNITYVAKGSCKECYGRGYVLRQPVIRGKQKRDNFLYPQSVKARCRCVREVEEKVSASPEDTEDTNEVIA